MSDDINAEDKNFISKLPYELQSKILSLISSSDIRNLASTNSSIRSDIMSNLHNINYDIIYIKIYGDL